MNSHPAINHTKEGGVKVTCVHKLPAQYLYRTAPKAREIPNCLDRRAGGNTLELHVRARQTTPQSYNHAHHITTPQSHNHCNKPPDLFSPFIYTYTFTYSSCTRIRISLYLHCEVGAGFKATGLRVWASNHLVNRHEQTLKSSLLLAFIGRRKDFIAP